MRGNGGVIGAANIPTRTLAGGCWGSNDVARFLSGQASGATRWPTVDADASFSSVKALYYFSQYGVDSSGLTCIPDFSGTGNHLYSRAYATSAGYGLCAAAGGDPGGRFTTTGPYSLKTPNLWASQNLTPTGMAFGTGAFDIGIWFWLSSLSTYQILLDTNSNDGVSALRPLILITSGDKIEFWANIGVGPVISGTVSVSSGAWHFVQATRTSGSTKLWLDNVQQGSTFTDSNNYVNDCIIVGNNAGGTSGQQFKGRISELRITVGASRSNAVPTTSFPNH